MNTTDIKTIVEANQFTTENTNGELTQATIDELNTELLRHVVFSDPETEDDVMEMIKTTSDRLVNSL